MKVVKLTVGYPGSTVLRQTRGGAWAGVRFVLNEDVEHCDGWVVLQSTRGLLRSEATRCPPGNVILITREPEDIASWPGSYCRQFAKVITCQEGLAHPHKILTQHGQIWHFRYKTYDELMALPLVPKPLELSVIGSDKQMTAGHRARFDFINALVAEGGFHLDRFGRGINPVEDKWDAIAPYRFHIVIENSQHPHYWTEKLTDCYLAYAFPIYYGASNIEDYFPPQAMLRIDIRDARAAMDKIREFLATHSYEELLPHIQTARELVLNRYNLFPTIVRHLDLHAGGEAREVILKPAFEFDDAGPATDDWTVRVRAVLQELAAVVSPGSRFILCDQGEWGIGGEWNDRTCVPFTERHNQYWGPPGNDDDAVNEVRRQCQWGAQFMVVGWPAFWWLDHYQGFRAYVQNTFPCLLRNERLVVFDLRR